jgi:hypothetical protein
MVAIVTVAIVTVAIVTVAIIMAISIAIVVVPLSFFVLVVSSEEVNCVFIFSFYIIAYNIESLSLQYKILRINKNEIYIEKIDKK